MRKEHRLVNIFLKTAQEVLDSSAQVTQEDKDKFKTNSELLEKSAKTISDWVDASTGQNTDNTRLVEFKRFSNQMRDAAKNFNTKVKTFLIDNSDNATIQNVLPELQTTNQNYNAIRPNYISETWMQQYSSSDEAKAMNQIRDCIKLISAFVQKQKNLEANLGNQTPLPNL